MPKIETKKSEIPLSRLVKTYQSTASSRTKELLEGLFPDLNSTIRLKSYPNVIEEKVKNGAAVVHTKYHYVRDGKVELTIEIPNKHTRNYGSIKIKFISYKMLDRIGYFRINEEQK